MDSRAETVPSERRASLRRRIVVWGTLTAALVVALAVVYFESQLLPTLEAVGRGAAGVQAAAGGADDLFAACAPEALSRRVERFLSGLGPAGQGAARPLARSWLAGVNFVYLGQLLFTLALVLPVALVLAAAAFVLAFAVEQAERKGWQGLSNRLIDLIDGVPYILWTIPFILLALAIHRTRPFDWRPPYWLYLALVFLGFGAFLLVFFLRQNRQQIVSQRVVLDGERMTGIGETRLFWRLFRFSFLPATFPRQWLYGAVFIMLFDFSFFTVLPTHQPGKTSTVFAEGNYLYERTLTARADAGCAFRDCYLEQLEQLSAAPLADAELAATVAATLRHPGLALDVERRRDVCQRVRQEGRNAGSEESRRRLDELSRTLELSASEQEAIFFGRLSRFYIQLNCCVTFALFFTVFMVFDARVLSDES